MERRAQRRLCRPRRGDRDVHFGPQLRRGGGEVSRFGGWNRVDRERVRETVLEADLSPLISADSGGAARLIGAAVWDDTPGEGPSWDLEDTGPSITEAPNWHVAVPERGPFLRLLIEDPEAGLDCVVSIAERATRRWAEVQRAYTDD